MKKLFLCFFIIFFVIGNFIKNAFNNATVIVQTDISSSTYLSGSGIIVPMYIYPSDSENNSDYNQLINLKNKYHNIPIITILNPDSGPGSDKDVNYSIINNKLKNAGILILGYVSTSYGVRGIKSVENDIKLWKDFYPEISGIFLDEVTSDENAKNIDYYKNISLFSHNLNLYPIVGNPGTAIPSVYEKYFDLLITEEDNQYPNLSKITLPLKKVGIILYDFPFNEEKIKALLNYFNFVYITDRNNSWGSLPTYFEKLPDLINQSRRY